MSFLNVEITGLEGVTDKFLGFSGSLPSLIHRGLKVAGAMLKRQIQKNLSGPAHLRFIYFDAGSRSARLSAAARGEDATRLRTSKKRLTGSRYTPTTNTNPFPGRRTGNLMGSVSAELEPGGMAIVVGPHTIYAAIHEFGGWAGRGRKVWIPARPYVRPAWLVTKDDIMSEFSKVIYGGLTA